MIDSDKIKIGDTVWLDIGGRAESGHADRYSIGMFGVVTWYVDMGDGVLCPMSESGLFSTKLDCLRSILKKTRQNA